MKGKNKMATNEKRPKLVVARSGSGLNRRRYYFANFALTSARDDNQFDLPDGWKPDSDGFIENNGITASKLCTDLLAIPGVRALTVSRYQLTVVKFLPEEWGEYGDNELGDAVDAIVREYFPKAVLDYKTNWTTDNTEQL